MLPRLTLLWELYLQRKSFQLILQHAAYHQIKGFDFAYNYKTTFDFLYM